MKLSRTIKRSWTQTLGVTGEQRSQTDVRQAEEEHNNTVQAETTAGVRRAALAESIEVILEALLVRLKALGAHRLLELLDIVDTLGTRHDFLATHEEVVRVGEAVVGGVSLGVEGTDSHGEFVQHVEIGVVLLADDVAELLLHGGGKVVLEALLLGHIDAGFLQQSNTVHVVHTQSLAVLGELEVASLGVGLLDGGDLGSVALLQLGENEHEQVLSELQNLVVVATESLLEIETGELYIMLETICSFEGHVNKSYLSQVAVGVAVLCTEYGGNLEDILHITSDAHLLVELGTLR